MTPLCIGLEAAIFTLVSSFVKLASSEDYFASIYEKHLAQRQERTKSQLFPSTSCLTLCFGLWEGNGDLRQQGWKWSPNL